MSVCRSLTLSISMSKVECLFEYITVKKCGLKIVDADVVSDFTGVSSSDVPNVTAGSMVMDMQYYVCRLSDTYLHMHPHIFTIIIHSQMSHTFISAEYVWTLQ